MKNENTHENDAATVDPEIAALLKSNPEASHFIASLAQGAELADAVRAHFGGLLEGDGPEEASAPAPEPAAEAEAEPAPMFAPAAAAAAEAPAGNGADEDDDFLSHATGSVWD